MILAILLGAHLLISAVILSIPNMTRKEILFGVAVPIDFRSSPEGRRAIRIFRSVVAVPAIGGLIAIAFWGARFVPWQPALVIATTLAGTMSFIAMNRKIKPFAVQPPSVRELELGAQPERLPWFTWLGLVPLMLLAAGALYLNAHWDIIPARYPIHFDLNGNPNRWADRSIKGVYGPLFFGMEMVVWFFGFALAIWYGSRRSEPLRKPTVGFLVAVEWALALIMAGVSLGPVMHLPGGAIALSGLPIVLGAVIYLMKKSNDPRAPMDPTPNECWKGGMIYYNPNDAALFVARRDSVGFTSNMANPWSWVMFGSIPALIAIGFLVMR
jgi:uncharacterized membrane protein